MTSLPERPARLWRLATLALLLALLAACGPGTGGTGTGPVDYSANLPAPTTGAGSAAAPGLPCSSCTRADLRLEEQRIELRLPCAHFVFTGAWDPDATELSLAGTIVPANGAAGVPGTLRLQFGSAGSRSAQVVATLFDAGGTQLFAATLQRSESALAPDACP